MIEKMGVSLVRWHDHFVVPRLDGHTIIRIRAEGSDAAIGKTEHDLNTEEDEEQIMSLRPNVLEQLQRHNVWRHLHPRLLRADDVLFINFYYAEAVYAPLYYCYGEPGSFADRSERAREWDEELLAYAPDVVLVHVTADPATVTERMATFAHGFEASSKSTTFHSSSTASRRNTRPASSSESSRSTLQT